MTLDSFFIKHDTLYGLASGSGPLIRIYRGIVLRDEEKRATEARSRLVEQLPKDRMIRFNGSKMHISESSGQDMEIFSLYLNKRLYEPSTGKIIKNNLKKGSTFIDCGASHGYFTLMASKLVGAAGKVYSFEAYPPTYRRLMRNIRLNKCTNVTAYNFAVGSKKGKLKMNLRYADGSNSFVNVPFSIGTEMVKVVRLDDMIKGRVDLIKMDVEDGRRMS